MPYPPLDPYPRSASVSTTRTMRCKECGEPVNWILAKVGGKWENQPCGHGASWTFTDPKARP